MASGKKPSSSQISVNSVGLFFPANDVYNEVTVPPRFSFLLSKENFDENNNAKDTWRKNS